MNHRYTPYKLCVLRTPIFPYSAIGQCESIDSLLSNDIFSEAIYIASSSLYQNLYGTGHEITDRARNSIIRYFSRACTRPTPYGLFAGCDLLSVDDSAPKSFVKLSNYDDYKTYTRVDMNILCDLVRKIEKDDTIKKNLIFHLNSTLYTNSIGHNYIEYILDSNRRKYTLSLLPKSHYIDAVIDYLKENINTSFSELIEFLIDLDVEKDVAEEFVFDLVNEGVLVSCLEPSVIGKDYIYQIIDKLTSINVSIEPFSEFEATLRNIDNCSLGKRINMYDSLATKLSSKDKYPAIYHVDLRSTIRSGVIGNDVINLVFDCASFLFNIGKKQDSPIVNFISEFYERFEEEEVPLCVALDSQIGIKYGMWHNTNGDINPLISGLPFPENKNHRSYSNDYFQQLLMNKVEEATANHKNSIDLNTIVSLESSDSDPRGKSISFYTIFSIVAISPLVIQMGGIVDASYSKLISRFQYLSPRFEDLVNNLSFAS